MALVQRGKTYLQQFSTAMSNIALKSEADERISMKLMQMDTASLGMVTYWEVHAQVNTWVRALFCTQEELAAVSHSSHVQQPQTRHEKLRINLILEGEIIKRKKKKKKNRNFKISIMNIHCMHS